MWLAGLKTLQIAIEISWRGCGGKRLVLFPPITSFPQWAHRSPYKMVYRMGSLQYTDIYWRIHRFLYWRIHRFLSARLGNENRKSPNSTGCVWVNPLKAQMKRWQKAFTKVFKKSRPRSLEVLWGTENFVSALEACGRSCDFALKPGALIKYCGKITEVFRLLPQDCKVVSNLQSWKWSLRFASFDLWFLAFPQQAGGQQSDC